LFFYSGININKDIVGLSDGLVCNDAPSTAVCKDGEKHFHTVIRTATHEIGHNFGMNHDKSKFWILFMYEYFY